MSISRNFVLSLVCVVAASVGCSGSSEQKKDDAAMTTESEAGSTAAEAPAEEETSTDAAETAAKPTEPAPAADAGPDFADPNVEGDQFFETWFKVTGQVDAEQVRGVIGRNKDSIYECYKKELAANPGLAGRVLVGITANGSGQVAAAIVKKSTLKNKTLEACMTSAIRGWKMPQSKDGGLVMVQYPFVLPP